MRRISRLTASGLLAALTLVALTAAGPAVAQTPAQINAGSPGVTIGPAHPVVTVPVTISRDGTTALLGFSVRIQLSSEFSALNTNTDVALGNFLTDGDRGAQLQVVSNGGGVYTIDGVTLGEDCGPTAQTGTLFTLALRSTATGTGTVTVQTAALRDCSNQPVAVDAGTSASVSIDNTTPVVTVTAPNGGETFVYQTTRNITWAATDGVGVANVDLGYSTNGGSSWTPIAIAEANDGTYAWAVPNAPTTNALVRVTAHDTNGNSASDASDAAFTILSNTAPVLGAIGDRTVDEETALTFTATAADGEAPPQTLTFSLDTGAPAGASIHPTSGAFSWTPSEAQGPGTYSITVRVTDDGSPALDDFETISVRVNDVNRAPTLATIPDQTASEGSVLTLTASATDPDLPPNTLTYSLTVAPGGASINPSTGAFSWTPGETDGGTSPTVTVRATDDGTALDYQDFGGTTLPSGWAGYLWTGPPGSVSVGGGVITVDGARANPEPSPAYGPGTSLEFVATFAAAPYQHAGFGGGNHLPSGEVFNTSPWAIFSTGSDGSALRARTWGGVQNDVTIPGSWLGAPHRYRIDWKSGSVDFWIDGTLVSTHSASITGPMRPAISDYSTGGGAVTVDWMKAIGPPALYDEKSFTVTVSEVNEAPLLTGVPSAATIPELVAYTFDADASDSDLPAQTLTFSLVGAPAGANIDGSTGAFTWTPSEAQGPGDYPFAVRVTDGVTNTDAAVTLHVTEVNVAPALTGVPSEATIPELVAYTFDADATDPDLPANTLMFSLVGAPSGAGIVGSTGVFTWTPAEDQGPGDYTFTVRVSDGTANTDASITLHVTDENSAPVLTGVPTGTVNIPEQVAYTFDANATDSDLPAQTLTFSLQGTVPAGAAIDGTTGVFTWTPAENQGPGDYPFTVRVSDGTANTEASFTLHVDEVNVAPLLTGVPASVTIPELVAYTFDADATDSDIPVQTLAFSLVGGPSGAAIDGSTGVFTWTPSEAQGPGDYTFAVRVTDGVTNTDASISIHVDEVSIAAIANLSASLVRSGNDLDGTMKVLLNWTATPGGTTVEVFRARFGQYPEYDDAGGVAPPVPGYPPSGAWEPVPAVTTPGQTDEVNGAGSSGRDYWTYAAFVHGAGSNVSGPSNRPATPNYLLGDVTDGTTDGQGNNIVNTSDISLLGGHYGLTGAAMTAFNYLDVGPTSDFSVNGRPFTDNAINFEDLVIFAINYGTGPAPQGIASSRAAAAGAARSSGVDRLTIGAPGRVTAGEEFTVELRLAGSGRVQALSAALGWKEGMAEPLAVEAGEWLAQQDGVVFSPRPGVADVALLGARDAGLAGEGVVARVRFRALATGDPEVSVAGLLARDAANAPVELTSTVPVQQTQQPVVTALSSVFPNPFRGNATIALSLAQPGPLTVTVFGVDGRRIRTLASGAREPGVYVLVWDGRDDRGQAVSAGIYFVQMTAAHGRFTKTIASLR